MHEPRVHHHPRNMSQEKYGAQLGEGDRHEPGDVYDCTDGTWRPVSANLYGQPIEAKAEIIVIRPLPVLVLGA